MRKFALGVYVLAVLPLACTPTISTVKRDHEPTSITKRTSFGWKRTAFGWEGPTFVIESPYDVRARLLRDIRGECPGAHILAEGINSQRRVQWQNVLYQGVNPADRYYWIRYRCSEPVPSTRH